MKTRVIFSLINLFSAYQMAIFALPKLSAAPISVNSFTQFGEVLGIDGHGYMLFTGGLELLIAVILFGAAVFQTCRAHMLLNGSGNLLLLGTMGGALVTELFVRPAPIPALVSLASTLGIIALVQLARTRYLHRARA